MARKTRLDPKAENRVIGAECAEMITRIEAEAQATAAYTGRPMFNPRVLAALAKIPRHEFVPASNQSLAYLNVALSIGYGQTISQPYIVALMTDLLDLDEESVVLEIGTGSGYQAAVLAAIARRVYSIEIIPALAEEAGVRLERLGISNVEVCVGDGFYGWPEHAPYDGILVAAAATEIPPPLIAQLKPGGRLVIPFGRPFYCQDLTVAEKSEDGQLSLRSVLPVAFVPFRREGAIEDEDRRP